LRRDWAEGAGPAVEAPSPVVVLEASLLVPPRVGAGWLVDADGCDVVVGVFAPPRLNRGVEVVAVLAPVVAGAELPPAPANKPEPGAPVVAVVVAAPLVAAVDAGVEAAGVPPNILELPVGAEGLEAPPNRLGVGAAEDVGVAVLPPRLNVFMLEAGCEAPVDAGVAPRLKVGALLAGVALC